MPSGDWDNDARSYLLYKGQNGNLLVATRNSHISFSAPTENQIGYGWTLLTGLLPAQSDRNTKAIWAVGTDGHLLTYFFADKK